jgi:predicted esterase YcpF (UPF0227 family)
MKSPKVQALLKSGEEVVCLGYDSFSTREEIVDGLIRDLGHPDPYRLMIVGTSLGAYYAAELARRKELPCVLINPCTDPFQYLSPLAGQLFENHGTGEKKTLSHDTAMSYRDHPLKTEGYFYRPLVLLDQGDEVFSSEQTEADLSSFETIVYPGGDHRFQHMAQAMPEIIGHLNVCSIASHMNF